MPGEIELIFIERFSQITDVADAKAVQFKDKNRSFYIIIRGAFRLRSYSSYLLR
jgi:hypothetical protein